MPMNYVTVKQPPGITPDSAVVQAPNTSLSSFGAAQKADAERHGQRTMWQRRMRNFGHYFGIGEWLTVSSSFEEELYQSRVFKYSVLILVAGVYACTWLSLMIGS